MSRLEDGGRIDPGAASSPYERGLLVRHLFAYLWVTENFIKEGDNVLELGAGEGYGSALMAKKAGRVTATDAGADAVAHAAARYKTGNLTFLQHADGRLPFADGEFDKVVSFQVIEHVTDPAAFVAEAARVLKPGGRFYLTTPNRVHRLKEGQRPWYKFHLREFSAGEIGALFKPPFSACEVSFVCVPQDHFDMELRVARLASLAQALDPLGLRDHIPYRLKQAVFSLISKKQAAAGPDPLPSDFKIAKEDRNGLDLWIEAVR